jgi:hypothetical protein
MNNEDKKCKLIITNFSVNELLTLKSGFSIPNKAYFCFQILYL